MRRSIIEFVRFAAGPLVGMLLTFLAGMAIGGAVALIVRAVK